MSAMLTPYEVLAKLAPDQMAELIRDPAALMAIASDPRWLRPNQRPPRGRCNYIGYIAGRGYGKSTAIATELNTLIEAGQLHNIALMAPTEPRVFEVQVDFLVRTAPPTNTPAMHNGQLHWPSGCVATIFTPEAPGRSRSGNFDACWLCELVDWQRSTRVEAFKNITTATRVGENPRVYWDTTSRGQNELIRMLLDLHAEDPDTYPIIRGSMFDNPLLSRDYLRRECRKYVGQEFDEEVLGKVFASAAGALFKKSWIDSSRLPSPNSCNLIVVAVDPGVVNREENDECGIIVGGREAETGHVDLIEDRSGHYDPDEWGEIVIDECKRRAAGVVIETNHLGDNARFVIESKAREHRMRTERLDPDRPFPERRPGLIYIRETGARESKGARASAPAVEMKMGRVHICGSMPELENEMCFWVPGGKSPNRLDAACYVVLELSDLLRRRPSGREIATASKASAELRAFAAQIRAGRRIGL